ncbi:MAG: alpha/beta hydrolase [Burkholderiaceae bacterium]|nr:alpha/beta hydrolase [Burkholderiaceae bacterium]
MTSRESLQGHHLRHADQHILGLALAYAARFYLSVVRRLILISFPQCGGAEGAVAWFARQRGGWIYTNMWAIALACTLTRRVVGRLLLRLLRDTSCEVAEDLVAHTMVSSTSSLWAAVYRHDLRAEAEASAPALPALVLHGSADLTAPLVGAQERATARSTREMRVLGGVDHHPWLRAPQQCLQYIGQWLPQVKELAPPNPAEPCSFAAGPGVKVNP